MLLPSVLPCENAFRISRSRTTTRSQTQRNYHHSHQQSCNGAECDSNKHDLSCRASTAANNFAQAIGLGLSITKPVTRTSTNQSCKALHQILSLDTTPRACMPSASKGNIMLGRYPMAPATPSDSDEPQTPEKQKIPSTGMWTTPKHEEDTSSAEMTDSMDEDRDETPTPKASNKHYTYTIVTRNNKRKRNGEAVNNINALGIASSNNERVEAPPVINNRFITPDPMTTPTHPPSFLPFRANTPPNPVASTMMDIAESDDELLNDAFITPKRSRIRGPASKRIMATRRNLGPWTNEEDSQLVTMVLAKIHTQLKSRDWAECANTLGRDGESVGERWKNLVEGGEVGLVCERQRERQKRLRARERMSGSGSGRLQPLRRAKEKARERNRRLSLGGRATRR